MEDFEDFGPDADDEYTEIDEAVAPSGRYSDPSEAHMHPDFA